MTPEEIRTMIKDDRSTTVPERTLAVFTGILEALLYWIEAIGKDEFIMTRLPTQEEMEEILADSNDGPFKTVFQQPPPEPPLEPAEPTDHAEREP